MPPFRKPAFPFSYDLAREKARLSRHFRERGVPAKSPANTLVATWNLANFGHPKQARRPKDIGLIAHILRRFDVVAVQEVHDNLGDLRRLLGRLGRRFEAVFTDPAGNSERMAYIYDRERVRPTELFAELALVDRQRRSVKVEFKGKTRLFKGFNRNPYIVSFARVGGKGRGFAFTLVNVHLYYGAASGVKFQDRLLEVKALSDWARKRSRAKTVYNDKIILLGDMNLPALTKEDPIYNTLRRRGLHLTDYTSNVDHNGSNLDGKRPYDQIAFIPEKTMKDYRGVCGIFDYDRVTFARLYDGGRRIKDFRAYLRYYVSDHRPLWAAFRA